ncbi:MAG TPA: hypothetical protein DDY39_10875 [Nitrospira sp.]|nr:hypothetical protein [Nitrospira sp.]
MNGKLASGIVSFSDSLTLSRGAISIPAGEGAPQEIGSGGTPLLVDLWSQPRTTTIIERARERRAGPRRLIEDQVWRRIEKE